MNHNHIKIKENFKIIPADIDAYNALKRFHYRGSKLGPYKMIFAITGISKRMPGYFGEYLGVIVYAFPPINCRLRNTATNNRYAKIPDKELRLKKINSEITTISRVIIDPRICGLSVACWLIEKTLSRTQTPVVEALAVMGHFNPFFEKAGMTRFTAPLAARCVRMQQAFYAVGITEQMLIDPGLILKHIAKLPEAGKTFIKVEIDKFLQSYGKARRLVKPYDRINYLLSRLTNQPVYYFWQNTNFQRRIDHAGKSKD